MFVDIGATLFTPVWQQTVTRAQQALVQRPASFSWILSLGSILYSQQVLAAAAPWSCEGRCLDHFKSSSNSHIL